MNGRSERIPFLLRPAAKDYLWGGTRLNDDFNLGLNANPLAEAWVCSCHPDGESLIAGTGETLSEVLKKNPDFLGTHAASLADGKMPVLIKFIDAKKDLSVQVHPDDEYAEKHEGQLGKTEMWYVLDARPGAELIYGFRRRVTPNEVRKAISDGTLNDLLNHVPVHQNDVFFIEAGTVHAIGAGCLIAEIQESSNLTYRLYDYDRTDKDGRKRPLHIDKALDVADLRSSVSPRQPMRVLKYKDGTASELLTRCKYFQAERMLLNTEIRRDLAAFQTGGNSFHVLLCLSGCGNISWDSGAMNFFKGDCIFVPAVGKLIRLHGHAVLLDVSC